MQEKGQELKNSAMDDLMQQIEEEIANDQDQWITVHPPSESVNTSGRHVLIDDQTGRIKAGLGGKYNGQKMKKVWHKDKTPRGRAGSKVANVEKNKKQGYSKKFGKPKAGGYSISEALSMSNGNQSKFIKSGINKGSIRKSYAKNPSHSCAAFCMACKGYKAEASPIANATDHILHTKMPRLFDAPTNTANSKADIVEAIKKAGDGSVFMITMPVKLNYKNVGLERNWGAWSFCAKNENGSIKFVCPTTGQENVERYFDVANFDKGVSFVRTDNAKPTTLIYSACEPIDKE